ncbi:hypothetical protein EHS25_001347 [Saitozyma podzolica]|uniref:Uncharacterized protein n=1 Tax=Saitozyma podzolica TaxID=1890683 RepID=A0A427YGE3_9TREE|nr:hypothetical protein EHS25_001347 [Saitozyma podzolica]
MAAVVCLLLYTGFDASKLRQSQGLGFAASYASSYSFSSETPSVPLDPVAQPGWIEGDTWVSANPEAPMHNWIRRIMDKEEGPDMDWMRNKTILVLGDSVVRDWIWRLCDNFIHGPREMVHLDPSKGDSEKTTGWLCTHPTYNLRIINGFIYGMTNYSRYPTDSPLISQEWPSPPWSFEDRMPELVEQYAGYEPDMIIANSGAWDFKFMYRRDLLENRKAIDVEPEERHEYGERLRGFLGMLRAAYPTKKVAFLLMHPFRANDLDAKFFWARGLANHRPDLDVNFDGQPDRSIEEKLPHLFSRRRVAQMASTYRLVAQQENMDTLDYWKIAEATEPDSFIRPGDAIHPADMPSIRIMLDFLMEKLYRWETYGV